MNRKDFIKKLSLSSGLLMAPTIITSKNRKSNPMILKPKRVRKGDVAAIVSPAGSVVKSSDIQEAVNAVKRLGLKPKLGKNLGSRWGYLGGRDTERLNDLHEAFQNPDVNVIFPIRGGYGSSRLLPMIDFDLIKKNPKAFIGYSDNTSLIVSMSQISGLVTFYGPNALSEWTDYTRKNWEKVVMQPQPPGMFSPPRQKRHIDDQPNFITIKSGRVKGQLLGGNLSLLIQTLGTDWEIDTKDKIIFFEDVNESVYKVDRMLTHLWLSRKLQDAAGFAIGHITNVHQEDKNVSLIDVIRDRFEPLGKPCYVGLTTGHISNILTLPVGVEVELNADRGTLTAEESAVI